MNRTKLVKQLIPFFLKFGYKKLTIDLVATSLSISKKTIYSHFSSKKELVSALNKELFNYFDELMRNAAKTTNNSIELTFAIRDAIENIIPLEEQRLFFTTHLSTNDQVADETIEMAKRILRHFSNFHFSIVKNDGYLNPKVDLDTIATVFANNYIGLLVRSEHEANEQFRKNMRTWHYMHMRSPLNNEAVKIIDEFVKHNPEVIS